MLRCEVIGNLGKDAEVKKLNEKEFVSFSVAHTEYTKNNDGTKSENTIWVSVLWYGNGGNLLNYLKKGAKVFVRGNLSTRIYTDSNNKSHSIVNVNATEVILCGSKTSNEQEAKNNNTKANEVNEFDGSDLPF